MGLRFWFLLTINKDIDYMVNPFNFHFEGMKKKCISLLPDGDG